MVKKERKLACELTKTEIVLAGEVIYKKQFRISDLKPVLVEQISGAMKDVKNCDNVACQGRQCNPAVHIFFVNAPPFVDLERIREEDEAEAASMNSSPRSSPGTPRSHRSSRSSRSTPRQRGVEGIDRIGSIPVVLSLIHI